MVLPLGAAAGAAWAGAGVGAVWVTSSSHDIVLPAGVPVAFGSADVPIVASPASASRIASPVASDSAALGSSATGSSPVCATSAGWSTAVGRFVDSASSASVVPSSSTASSERRTAASSICATSTTSMSSLAPSDCLAVRPSESMTRQNGHPTAMRSAPVAMASSVRLTLIRVPSFSSIHMRAPPAPQQNEVMPERGISRSSTPGSDPMSSRGGA